MEVIGITLILVILLVSTHGIILSITSILNNIFGWMENLINGLFSSSAGTSGKTSQYSLENSCMSSVQNTISALEQRISSSDQVSIANTQYFGQYVSTEVAGPQAASMQGWAQQWYEDTGTSMKENPTYLNGDISQIISGSMYAEGVAVRIQASFGGGTVVYIDPLLCGNGTVMPNSYAYLADNQANTP